MAPLSKTVKRLIIKTCILLSNSCKQCRYMALRKHHRKHYAWLAGTTRKEMREALIALTKQGKRPSEIVKAIGCSPAQATYYRRQLGLPKLPRGGGRGFSKASAANAERARLLKVSGMTYAEIGTALGVTRQRAQQLLRITIPEDYERKCQRCGTTAGRLSAHHTDYATDAWELLCLKCHLADHKPSTDNPKAGRPKRPKPPEATPKNL